MELPHTPRKQKLQGGEATALFSPFAFALLGSTVLGAVKAKPSRVLPLVAALTAPSFRAARESATARGALRLFAPAQEAVLLEAYSFFPVPSLVRPGELSRSGFSLAFWLFR